MPLRTLAGLVVALLTGILPAVAAGSGSLAGRVTDPAGIPLEGVRVVVPGAELSTLTDPDGRWRLDGLPAGPTEIELTSGELTSRVPAVVEAGRTVELEAVLGEAPLFGEELTVRAASRYAQRLVEAPAAVTTIGREEIARRAPSGNLPLLFSGDAAAELAQGGLYDFNLNARGFNGSTNRRVLALIDGRDPSLPVFSGAQEWAALSFGLDRYESAEMVRGPGAALYGAGAYNGVLDLRTRPVDALLGGRLRLTGGELDTRRIEGSWAGGSERVGFLEVLLGAQRSRDFLRSRVGGAEYHPDRMPPEVIGPPLDEVESWAADLRYRRDLGPTRVLELEAGTGAVEGAAVVTGVGRLQRLEVERPWARFEVTSPRWSVLAASTGRDSNGEVSLATGDPIYLDSTRTAIEAQANTGFLGGRGRAIGGLSFTRLEVDSAAPDGRQTIFAEEVDSEHQAVFGQVEADLAGQLRGVASLRWDDSDLHDSRWSPRAALVLALGPARSVRLTWSEAFQSPTLSELNVRVAVAPPLDLSGLEEALAPLLGGVSLGLDAVPLLAVGNPGLDVEEVETWELGFHGTVGRRTLVSASVYRSELRDFTTNLVPAFGTSLGPLLSPPTWRPPAALSPEAAATVLAALDAALPPGFVLAAAADGSPFFPLLSFGSFGRVETTGAEASLDTIFGDWRFGGGVSWFDHEVRTEAAEHPLAPNRAPWQATLSASRTAAAWTLGIDWRWSDAFDYRSGIFVGPVPSYSVVDLTAAWRPGERWGVGLSVANALDEAHWEAFGGDVLGRRALVHFDLEW